MTTRFNNLPTLKVDAGEKIPFTYKGKKFYGAKGDTIATALYANGIRIFARSLKYHRPRGFYSMDGECSNTMMEVDGIPNVRSETTLLKPNMEIKEQNVKGSAENDMMAFMDKMSFAMPAGHPSPRPRQAGYAAAGARARPGSAPARYPRCATGR